VYLRVTTDNKNARVNALPQVVHFDFDNPSLSPALRTCCAFCACNSSHLLRFLAEKS